MDLFPDLGDVRLLLAFLQNIQWTSTRSFQFPGHMEVYHGGLDILMPKQLLDFTDIGPVQEHVRCVAVPHRMNLDMFCDLGSGDSPVVCSGERTFIHVMSPHDAVVGIYRQIIGREYELPTPFLACVGIFPRKHTG